jgi:hypothetical protein
VDPVAEPRIAEWRGTKANEGKRMSSIDEIQPKTGASEAYEKHLIWVGALEAKMRAFLAATLVLGTFGVVLWAIVWKQLPQDISLLLTPLVGLAGIGIGYYFGRGVVAQSAPIEEPRPNTEKTDP